MIIVNLHCINLTHSAGFQGDWWGLILASVSSPWAWQFWWLPQSSFTSSRQTGKQNCWASRSSPVRQRAGQPYSQSSPVSGIPCTPVECGDNALQNKNIRNRFAKRIEKRDGRVWMIEAWKHNCDLCNRWTTIKPIFIVGVIEMVEDEHF